MPERDATHAWPRARTRRIRPRCPLLGGCERARPGGCDRFYSGLFGWEFEDVMPPEAPGKYFMARIRGLDVAAVGWIPDAAPPMATWNTLPLCMESSGLGSADPTPMRGAAS